MSDQGRLLVRYSENAALVECLDTRLNEELTIQAWGEELYAALESIGGCTRMVVNFENVQFLSSSALPVLITLNNKAKAKKVTIFLCCIKPDILNVFKITKLDSIFKIRDTELEAIRSK